MLGSSFCLTPRTRGTTLVALAAFAVGASTFIRPASADLIRLKNGGDLRGTIDRRSGPTSDEVTIESLSGAVIVVGREHVQFVTRRPMIVEEYETLARKTAETVEGHWDMAEWCRENALKSQRDTHLARVVELDPEHEAAHKALGHILHDGEWTTRDEMMASQGYVKHRGKYITPQELELIEKSKAELESERDWFIKIRLWHGWVNGRNDDRRQQGLALLSEVGDPSAIPALTKLLRGETSKALRILIIGVLRDLPGDGSTPALVGQSLTDDDVEIRWMCLNGLQPEDYATARAIYLKELKSKSNATICRAAASLERVGDEACVPALIQALSTTHTYKVYVPDRQQSISFDSSGQFALGGSTGISGLTPEIQAGIATGQINPNALNQISGQPTKMKLVTFKHHHDNKEVLGALQRITGQAFGFDKRSWNLWWTAKKNATL